MNREERAPAKVNLYLHVGPIQADGYHPVESLMVFADAGDAVVLDPDAPGFAVEGPFAGPLTSEADNLVTRARDLFLEAFGGREVGLRLAKRLPIAAGLGGGSSDAAAALRLLAAEWGVSREDPQLLAIAARLGADVPACLRASAVIGRGRGDRLSPAPALPGLAAVLANPGLPSPTGAVYRAFDASPPPGPLAAEPPGALKDVKDVVSWLKTTRNDLERPAIAITPRIGEALAELAQEPEALLARMSGSGATVFALCDTPERAEDLAARLRRRHPDWWVERCRLGP